MDTKTTLRRSSEQTELHTLAKAKLRRTQVRRHYFVTTLYVVQILFQRLPSSLGCSKESQAASDRIP